MTGEGKRNEVRKFCATFSNALAIGGVAASIFGLPGDTLETELLRRFATLVAGLIFFYIGYSIMERLETDPRDD